MAAGSNQLSQEEVQRQLEILGYDNFSPEKLRQITQDLQLYLADEGFQTETTDESYVSESSSYTDDYRQPLHEVGARREEPPRPKMASNIYGKENFSTYPSQPKHSYAKSGLQYIEDSSFDSTRDDDHADRELYHKRQAKRRPMMKRKVVRRKNGESHVFDESITESESDVSYLNDRLVELRIPLREDRPHRYEDEDDGASESSSITNGADRRRARSASPALYSHRPAESEGSVYKPHLPRSFIRPLSAQPKTKHDKKTDPVTRHQMYQAHWNAIKAPGEKNHKGLRWSIREQMLCKDEVSLPKSNHRVYVPNTYKVPTEKKRQALRWAVRSSLANREMPYSSFQF